MCNMASLDIEPGHIEVMKVGVGYCFDRLHKCLMVESGLGLWWMEL